jgi:hypothetical protein
MQLSTVGWVNARPIIITVDLGSQQPIRGAAFSTAAGVSDASWPIAIYVLVSDDGKTFHSAGDLVADSAQPPADGYHAFRYTTDRWRTHGRYVQFVVDGGGIYVFADEVEVYAGEADWLNTPTSSRPVTDTMNFLRDARTQTAIRHRLEADARAAQAHLDAVRLPANISAGLRTKLDRLNAEVTSLGPIPIETFRAVLPLNDLHARIYAVEGEVAEASGAKPLAVWAANPWDFLSPVTALSDAQGAEGPITVAAMRGETRAAALNVANSSARPVAVSITIGGLPGGVNPGYVKVHEVIWTDTRELTPVGDALQELAHSSNAYRITVPAGMTRQVYLSVTPTSHMSAGSHRGRIVVSSAAPSSGVQLPFVLRVFDQTFPKVATLHLGGFDYMDSHSMYGVTRENAAPLLVNLRDHFVDSPWATRATVPFGVFDGGGRMVTPPTTREFDRWISLWNGASRFCIFIGATDRIGSISGDSPMFERAVGEWITFWVEHASQIGVRPEQLLLLIVDEPHARSQDELIVRWAKAIKSAQPRVLIWENPTYTNPSDGLPDMFQVSDVLTPNREMLLRQGSTFANFYRTQRTDGHGLELYSSTGPARLLDPYSYYRLQAWNCFELGAGASHFWAFSDSADGSSWNEYAINRDAFTPLFIDRTSVTGSKHMEAIREGVEDFEYLVQLRERIQVTERANPGHVFLARARSILGSAAQRVLGGQGASESRWASPKDRGIADAVRVEIAEALQALR